MQVFTVASGKPPNSIIPPHLPNEIERGRLGRVIEND